MTVPAQFRTPAEQLRAIADERLDRGSAAWAELHRISGYIEGLEDANNNLAMRLARAEARERGEPEV